MDLETYKQILKQPLETRLSDLPITADELRNAIFHKKPIGSTQYYKDDYETGIARICKNSGIAIDPSFVKYTVPNTLNKEPLKTVYYGATKNTVPGKVINHLTDWEKIYFLAAFSNFIPNVHHRDSAQIMCQCLLAGMDALHARHDKFRTKATTYGTKKAYTTALTLPNEQKIRDATKPLLAREPKADQNHPNFINIMIGRNDLTEAEQERLGIQMGNLTDAQLDQLENWHGADKMGLFAKAHRPKTTLF